jgi:rhamnosyltransferase
MLTAVYQSEDITVPGAESDLSERGIRGGMSAAAVRRQGRRAMTDSTAGRSPTVSVVIPTLNAAPLLPRVFEAIFNQQPTTPVEVVLVDSMSTDATRRIAAADVRVRVIPIQQFSHGRARNLGAREARGEIVVLLTQDALPADEHWLAGLLTPFSDPQVVATYSRQVPHPDANPMERFFLRRRFPPGSPVRRERRGDDPLSLEDVFFSNVGAAIRREVLLRHPFDEDLIMSEDQQFSRDVIAAGHAVVYQPESVVIHSHNYSLATCFRRYFDSVYSLTLIFPRHGFRTTTTMGAQYLADEVRYMVRNHPKSLPRYLLYNLAKVGGALAAHLAESLPRRLARTLSLHRYHWGD